MGVFFEKKKQGFRFARTRDAYFQEIKNVEIFFVILVGTRKFREKMVFFSKNGKTEKNGENRGKTGVVFWGDFWWEVGKFPNIRGRGGGENGDNFSGFFGVKIFGKMG